MNSLTKIIGIVSIVAIVLSVLALSTSLRTQVNPTQPTQTPTATAEPKILSVTFYSRTIGEQIQIKTSIKTPITEVYINGQTVSFASQGGIINIWYTWTSLTEYDFSVNGYTYMTSSPFTGFP